jgi:hypothetical protein
VLSNRRIAVQTAYGARGAIAGALKKKLALKASLSKAEEPLRQ